MQKKCRRVPALLFFWLIIYSIGALSYLLYTRQWQPIQQKRFNSRQFIYDYQCQCPVNGKHEYLEKKSTNFFQNGSTTNAYQRILLFIKSTTISNRNKSIIDYFNYFKVPLWIEKHFNGNRLLLEVDGMARFSIIVFEDYRIYNEFTSDQKELLKEYCKKYSIGIVSFLILDQNSHMNFTDFVAYGKQRIRKLSFLSTRINRIGKTDCIYDVNEREELNSTLFKLHSKNAIPLLKASTSLKNNAEYSALLLGHNHVVIGTEPVHWSVKVLLLDAVNYLSPGIYDDDLERFIQIDIDDIFVGATGSRLIADDVYALSNTQKQLRHEGIENFTFTLGFSGYYFRHGNEQEMQGDELLLANAQQFLWFPHMWRHNHVHEFAADYLLALMAQNKMFANTFNLPTSSTYAVSPQHSGVYPVYEPLYDGWKRIWNVEVTSTEEYPHLKPASKRMAFVHSNISVLPRQTCGLFTHTQYFQAYPGGIERFVANIFGGDLFATVLMKKFSIFMTHQQNYANDRLGSYAFVNLVKFIKCWTNLKLRWIEPKKMAEYYFKKNSQEKTLFYTNICLEKRHRRMLPANNSCANWKLPNLIILGPQKTGTTALAMFLKLHPNISTNIPIRHSFEELQFFAGQNYAKGVDWYADKFATSVPSNPSIIFEKTANYFDNPSAPKAIHALLPDAKLIVILNDPVRRAYSWYQHMRAHNDSIALKYSAEQIFMGNMAEAEKLKRRALWPGHYAKNLDNWLDYFSISQLIIIDGDRLRNEPHFVLHELFEKFQMHQIDGLQNRLQYSKEKGFYCIVQDEKATNSTTNVTTKKMHCLGSSKGRQYKPISMKLRRYLETYFKVANKSLLEWLQKYQFPVPYFLL